MIWIPVVIRKVPRIWMNKNKEQ